MKKTKTKKLEIKKVTLQDLDDPSLDAVAGGVPITFTSCPPKCLTCIKC